MRSTLLTTMAIAGLLGGLLLMSAPQAAAQDNVAKDARLMTLDGEFSKAQDLLDGAPEEIQKDPKLRMQLGDMALKWARRKEGTQKVPGLIFARGQFAKASELQPDDIDAATAAVETALELVDIQIEAKQPTTAKEHASWAVKIGESVLEGGADTVDLRLAIAKAHDQHAKLSHKIQDFDSIVADYGRSADLLVSCADEAKKPEEALSDAARVYLDLALFVAEGRPIEEEKRDDAALLKGLEIAKRACEMEGASKPQFTIHLLILRELYRAKVEGDHGTPYMQEMGQREGVDGLDLFIPKSDGWKKLDKSGDWDLVLERKLEGDDTAVQILVRFYPFSESFGGKTWDRVEDVTKLRYEDQKANDFQDVAKDIAPVLIEEATAADTGSSKKKKKAKPKKDAPEIWHFELSGTAGGRRRWVSEYTMLRAKKEKKTYHIRLIDWRVSPDLNEPDLVLFVEHALGLVAPPEEDSKGKKKR